MNKITTVGIGLAKNVFQLHGIDAAGKVVLRREVRRAVDEDHCAIPVLFDRH